MVSVSEETRKEEEGSPFQTAWQMANDLAVYLNVNAGSISKSSGKTGLNHLKVALNSMEKDIETTSLKED